VITVPTYSWSYCIVSGCLGCHSRYSYIRYVEEDIESCTNSLKSSNGAEPCCPMGTTNKAIALLVGVCELFPIKGLT